MKSVIRTYARRSRVLPAHPRFRHTVRLAARIAGQRPPSVPASPLRSSAIGGARLLGNLTPSKQRATLGAALKTLCARAPREFVRAPVPKGAEQAKAYTVRQAELAARKSAALRRGYAL